MRNNPLVSVIIPVLNGASFIGKAIESVQKQRFNDVEIIVVDDGSTDDTQQVVKGLQTTVKIRLLHQDHAGPAISRNYGISRAQGQYVALLDCDDLWLPDKLALQLDVMNKMPDVGLVHSDYEVINPDGKFMYRVKARYSKDPTARAFHGGHVAIPSTVLIRKDVLDSIKGFDPHLYNSEDGDLRIRLYEVTKFECVDQVLMKKVERGPGHRDRIFDEKLDFEKGFGSRERFLNKLESKIHLTRAQRAALNGEWANYYLDLGKTHKLFGKGSEARRCYLQAIKWAPFRFRAYSRYIRAFT